MSKQEGKTYTQKELDDCMKTQMALYNQQRRQQELFLAALTKSLGSIQSNYGQGNQFRQQHPAQLNHAYNNPYLGPVPIGYVPKPSPEKTRFQHQQQIQIPNTLHPKVNPEAPAKIHVPHDEQKFCKKCQQYTKVAKSQKSTTFGWFYLKCGCQISFRGWDFYANTFLGHFEVNSMEDAEKLAQKGLVCRCGYQTVELETKSAKNKGKKYHSCAENHCGFFVFSHNVKGKKRNFRDTEIDAIVQESKKLKRKRE